MKKPMSVRTKVEASLVIVLLLIVAIGSSTVAVQKYGTDSEGLEWIGEREKYQFASTVEFIVGVADVAADSGFGHYYAINGSDGTNFSYGELADVLNACNDQLRNGTSGITGGIIKLRQGIYNLKDQVRLKPGVTIMGSGGLRQGLVTGTTISCYLSTTEGAAFSYDDTLYGSGWNAVCIRDIQFACYHTEPTYAYVYLKNSLYSRIENCVIGMGNAAGSTHYSIFLDGSLATWIENCDIRDAKYDGIYMNTSRSPSYEPCNAVIVSDSWIRGNDRDGIYIDEGATAVVIASCAITGNGRYDINMGLDGDTYGEGPQKCIIRDNYFGESSNVAVDYPSIHLRDTRYTTIDSCYFHDSYFINSSYTDKNYLKGNVVSNCYMNKQYNITTNHSVWLNGNDTVIENCVMPGIRVDWGENYSISNCVITRDDLGIALNNTYTGNTTLIGNSFTTLTGFDGTTTMLANPGIATSQLSGLDYIYHNGTQAFRFNITGTGNSQTSVIMGSDGQYQDLRIVANSNGTYTYLQLDGGTGGEIAMGTASDFQFKEVTTRIMVISGGTDNVAIGTTAPPDAHADLYLTDSGELAMKESDEPTATADYGKIYTTSDNKLYFQDGDGNLWSVNLTAVP